MRAIIVQIYKGKGRGSKCKNYRGISLLSKPGKVYGRILMEKLRSLTGFRSGRDVLIRIKVCMLHVWT